MIVSIIVGILVLSVLIFVHELFHFWIAKASSIGAPVFSIGFGPKLLSFKLGETEFRISAIPFGGFVELKGMEPDDMKGEKDEFYSKNTPIRLATVLGGPFSNILFGFFIYLCIFAFYGVEVSDTTVIGKTYEGSNLLAGDKILKVDDIEVSHWMDITDNIKKQSEITVMRDGKVKSIMTDSIIVDSLIPQYPAIIGRITKGGPAYDAGIRKGSQILSIDGNIIDKWSDITEYIYPSAGDTLEVLFEREGDTILASVIPQEEPILLGDSVVKRGVIGIMAPMRRVRINFREAFSYSVQRTWFSGTLIYKTIKLLISREVSPRNIAGPVGIVMMTEKQLQWGLISLLGFVALISINLAVVNLIPIPPLDGFHFIVSLVSGIIRRKPSKRMLKIVQNIGFIMLFSLMMFVILNDILRIFNGG